MWLKVPSAVWASTAEGCDFSDEIQEGKLLGLHFPHVEKQPPCIHVGNVDHSIIYNPPIVLFRIDANAIKTDQLIQKVNAAHLGVISCNHARLKKTDFSLQLTTLL